jgi:glycosyltransferase involved in cell wall biosynthesis
MAHYRVAYLVSKPVHSQAPLLRLIAADAEITLKVYFRTIENVTPHVDAGFGRQIAWDVPLLQGYEYEVLPAFGSCEERFPWRPLSYGLRPRLRKAGTDAIWVHGYAWPFHILAILQARTLGLKIVVRDEATLMSRPRSAARRAAKRLAFWFLRRWCDGFLAIGRLNREYYEAYHVPPHRIFHMPYAVDNDWFGDRLAEARSQRNEFKRSLELEEGRPIVLYVSKLTSRKRPFDLLAAFRVVAEDPECRRPYLLFVGDGPERKELERLCARTGGSDARVLGFRNQSELPALYDLADVFVLPSVDEPWAVVVNEAMTAACAIIASDQVGAAGDLVREGENGFVFPARDVPALASALKRTLRNAEYCARLGQRSVEIVSEYSLEADLVGLKDALRTAGAR